MNFLLKYAKMVINLANYNGAKGQALNPIL
jgi:hypothetical protein